MGGYKNNIVQAHLKKSPTLLHLPNNLLGNSLAAATVFPYIQKALFYYTLCFLSFYFTLLLYPLTLIE